MKQLFTLILLATLGLNLTAQPPCPDGELSLIITVQTDAYGHETGWEVVGNSGTVYGAIEFNTLANHTQFQNQVCVPADECITLRIRDSFGDGIFQPGFYTAVLEGDTIAMGGDFTYQDITRFNCEPGEDCDTALPISVGQHTTLFDNTWYIFEPDTVGLYEISTCGFTDCDTKIWVYDNCNINGQEEDNKGTVFFDDDQSDCAPQAVVTGYMEPGNVYYIRIGDNMDACDSNFVWELNYLGEIEGCTDPFSCNYNPLATIDDGSCLPQGDPDCPEGPDLNMREDILVNSLQLDQVDATDPCMIEEGCLAGYGIRDVIRFTTRIENIGAMDYYIGPPSLDNSQFTFSSCHNHYHYDGYAEYILFTEQGEVLPPGFKNGFCVIDLGCMTGTAQYGCGNMGISAGCFDEYWSALSCQWIDVTDVPDGRYTFVTRVNWDNAPDFLGRYEKDTLNNWAQACIILDRSSGALQMVVDPDCAPYVDCMGVAYGNARQDCAGVCNGTTLRGDLDANGLQEMVDAETYVNNILAQDIEASPCNDLNADGNISVYDAALLSSCLNYGASHVHEGEGGTHNHCNFPDGTLNTIDTVTLTILDANFEENYIDIGMSNPYSKINAYQFNMSGITTINVENLVDPSIYPITPHGNINQSMVIGISYEDSLINKSLEYQALCRIHYLEITADFICIDSIFDIVNANYEQVITRIEDGCVEAPPMVDTRNLHAETLNVTIQPNPFNEVTRLAFSNPAGKTYQLEITDLNGKVLRTYPDIRTDAIEIQKGNLSSGMYFYRLSGKDGTAVGKITLANIE